MGSSIVGSKLTVVSASRVAVAMTRDKTLILHYAIEKAWLVDVGEIGGLNTKAEEPEPVVGRAEVDDPDYLGRYRYHIVEGNIVVPVHAIRAIIVETELGIQAQRIISLALP